MNPKTLSQTAVLAQHIDTTSDVLDKDTFRYKAWDCINKSNIQIFENEGLIEQDPTWNAWNWTEDAQIAVRAVRRSPITEASDEQLERFRDYSEVLVTLPLNEEFLVSDHDGLVGRRVGNLREAGIIEIVGECGKVSVWQLTDFAVRVLNSIAAQERQQGNFRQTAVLADD